MKNYLLLEDGTCYATQNTQFGKNFLGVLTKSNNQIGLVSKATGEFFGAVLSDSEKKCLESKINGHNGFLGKFVVDELPIDYHVYDLKTAF